MLKDLEFLTSAQGLNVVFPDDYLNERMLTRFVDCFAIMKRLGMSANQCRALAEGDVTRDNSSSVKLAAKAKYDEAQWLNLAKPLRNLLREKQRAALVAYLVPHLKMRRNNDLYEHFLIDVEMDPCMMTSRIKQAISSVQLFVQRCLMNLEPNVDASLEADEKWRHWDWMKNYRVWEANRKIFLYPENWIEPELRDDKSPFFKELESELLQNDLNDETAEAAFLHYLEKLDQVARLEIVGLYRQEETDDADNKTVDLLHVFGRTYETPHIYYYRRRVDSSYWTAWEKVDVDIEGDHLIPVVWNRRLYLLWPIFTEKVEHKPIEMPGTGKPVKEPKRYYEIQLAWSEYKKGKWLAKRLSQRSLETKHSQYSQSNLIFRKNTYTFKTFVDISSGALVVRCLQESHLEGILGWFRFESCNGDVTAISIIITMVDTVGGNTQRSLKKIGKFAGSKKDRN